MLGRIQTRIFPIRKKNRKQHLLSSIAFCASGRNTQIPAFLNAGGLRYAEKSSCFSCYLTVGFCTLLLQTLFSVSELHLPLLTRTHPLIQPAPCKVIDAFVLGSELLLVLWFEALYTCLFEWQDGFNPRQPQGIEFSSGKVWGTASCGMNEHEMFTGDFLFHALVPWIMNPGQTYNFNSLRNHSSFVKAEWTWPQFAGFAGRVFVDSCVLKSCTSWFQMDSR